jgi:hypothetical protein
MHAGLVGESTGNVPATTCRKIDVDQSAIRTTLTQRGISGGLIEILHLHEKNDLLSPGNLKNRRGKVPGVSFPSEIVASARLLA